MPTDHYERVKAFMEKATQATPSNVVIPDAPTRELRARLILEEALETIDALGVSVKLGHQRIAIQACELTADQPVDLEGVADGCADISVVTIGTLIAFGIDDEKLLLEVDTANLRKFGPGSYTREDGKWMKPSDWMPPDIAGVLESQ